MSKAKKLSDIKNLPVMKKLLVILVVIILLVIAGYILMPADCALGTQKVYAGQPVDNEQAIAKLAGFIGGLNRTQFPARLFSSIPQASSLVIKEAHVTHVKNMGILLNSAKVQVSGFIMDVPYKDGDHMVYGDGYFISEDDGYLYKMNRVDCK